LTFFLFCIGSSDSITSYANSGATDFLADYQEQFKELFSGVDEDTISDVFDFLQEKIAEGSLKSESGIEDAIKEGKEKLGIDGELSEEYIKSMIELATTLENMGFNSEKIIEKAREMYEEYGIDFIDHTEELIYEAVKASIGNIIKNAIIEFFRMIGVYIKELVSNLF
jgi:uncharacterized protein YpuA (DUF1002 family)